MRIGMTVGLFVTSCLSSSCVICDRFWFWEVRGQIGTADTDPWQLEVTLVFGEVERRAVGDFDAIGGYMAVVSRPVACETADEILSPPEPDEVIVTIRGEAEEQVVKFAGSVVEFQVLEPTYARIDLPDIELSIGLVERETGEGMGRSRRLPAPACVAPVEP
jgi:hypothetical protein